MLHTELPQAVIAALAERGTVATMATTRAMARSTATGDAAKSSLVELKAVDPALYPLVGKLETEPAATTPEALASRDGVPAPWWRPPSSPASTSRSATGFLGDMPLRIAGVIRSEPDRLAGGLGFGPRLILSMEAFRASD